MVLVEATLRKFELQWLLVSLGASGMSLLNQDGRITFISAQARQIYYVSGAGDTVISTLAFGVAAGRNFVDAARLANLAAGIVAGELGTLPITSMELNVSLLAGE